MKFLGYLLLFFFTYTINAFQDDFESINSDDKLNAPLVNIRSVYNQPFSYCAMDDPPIPPKYCGNVSVFIGKNLFKRIYYKKSISDSMEYGHALYQSDVERIIANMHLTTYLDKPWLVPTEGQLSALQREGLVILRDQMAYWVRDSSSGALRTVSVKNDNKPNRAKIYRLVTDQVPSDCKDSECPLFKDPYRDWKIQLATASAFRIQFEWGYTLNGQSKRWRGAGGKLLNVPGRAVAVWLDMWHTGQAHYAARWKHLEKQHGTSDLLCAKIFGSLAVSHGELHIGGC